MNPQVKKEWKTPELIVLVRSKPEEAVLTFCKGNGTTKSGSNICKDPVYSTLCSAISGS